MKQYSKQNLKKFIEPSYVAPGKMCSLVKTHKDNNPVRVITNNPVRVTTNGCRTEVENLSVFIPRCSYLEFFGN